MPDPTAVVVTGRGVLTPIGEGPEAFWAALLAGRSGVRRLARTDARWYRNPFGCEIPTPDPLNPDRPELGRGSALLLRATRAAAVEADLAHAPYPATRIGVVVGSALLDLRTAEDLLCAGRITPAFIRDFSMAGTIARDLGLGGADLTLANACAAGAVAVAVAADWIAAGELDCVVAAGADTISESMLGLADRANLRTPTRIAPFDRKRGGPLLGEGAAAVVLERADGAVARRARVYGEIAGAGLTCDAASTHAPSEDGVAAAIAEALARAGVAPAAVDYVCAHGTATPANDTVETAALVRVLGPRAHAIPVSAIKSMIGHTSGASGAVALVATLLAIEHGVVPPTMNLEEPDEGLTLNYVPNRPQPWRVDTALVNAFGFGGNNCCLVARRWAGAGAA
jgi:3-oxoacyl-[acyl-carrier-protein] synthase II